MTNGPVAAEADALWRKQLGPLLTVTATASELSIPAGDGVLPPAFQFSDGKPLPRLKEILTVFTPVVKTPFTVASWFTGPQLAAPPRCSPSREGSSGYSSSACRHARPATNTDALLPSRPRRATRPDTDTAARR